MNTSVIPAYWTDGQTNRVIEWVINRVIKNFMRILKFKNQSPDLWPIRSNKTGINILIFYFSICGKFSVI